MSFKGDSTWKVCFVLEHVVLPPLGHIGFSAETGELSDSHSIISVDTFSIDDTNNIHSPHAENHMNDSGLGFFARHSIRKRYIFLFLLCVAATCYWWFKVSVNGSRNYKRF